MKNKNTVSQKTINFFPGQRDTYCLPFKDYPTQNISNKGLKTYYNKSANTSFESLYQRTSKTGFIANYELGHITRNGSKKRFTPKDQMFEVLQGKGEYQLKQKEIKKQDKNQVLIKSEQKTRPNIAQNILTTVKTKQKPVGKTIFETSPTAYTRRLLFSQIKF